VEHIEPMDFGIYARGDYYFGYSDPEYDALITAYEIETDERAVDVWLRRIQSKIADDAVNVFLMQSAQLGIWKSNLGGLWVDTPIPANVAVFAYFDGGGSASASTDLRVDDDLTWMTSLAVAAVLVLLAFAIMRMGAVWLLGRMATHAVTLLAATVVVFVVLQILPGDPATYMMGMNASAESVAALREQMGLDAPAFERYFSWLAGLVSGQFGTSYTYLVPVRDLLAERLSVSAPLAVFAVVLSLLMALPAGVVAASRRGSVVDTTLNAVMQVGIAVPNFWLGLLLILFLDSTDVVWRWWFRRLGIGIRPCGSRPVPAGARAGRASGGDYRKGPQDVAAGDDERRLRENRQGQGPDLAAGALAPRPAQRDDSRSDDYRPATAVSACRRYHHRECILITRRRPAGLPGDYTA